MNSKFGQLFFLRINAISKYSFWFYFLFLIGYYYLFDSLIPNVLTYLFWLLLGFRAGTVLTIKAMKTKIID